MASVHFTFTPPDVPDLVSMKIWEASNLNSLFSVIDTVSPIGIYPDYINNYTTIRATDESYFFAIEFIDEKGATTGLSQAVQGNQQLAIGQIQRRVLERDSTLREIVVLQEAESALNYAFPGYINPYDPMLKLSYIEIRGLTNLTLAMCYLTELARGQSTSWTAGIVSLKQSDVALKMREKAIDRLIIQANRDLALSFSMVAFLEDIEIAGGTAMATIDETRLLVELR